MKFDGKAFGSEIESQVKAMVSSFATRPKIVSFLVGDDPASALYTRLKKEAAERAGINFEIVKIDSDKMQVQSLSREIVQIGNKNDVTGVMVQLPIPGLKGNDLESVIESIPLDKDVDGLRYPDSKVVPPVVKAIIAIIDKIGVSNNDNYVVVGASGSVGRPLIENLLERGVVNITEIESSTQEPNKLILQGRVVISCVGKEGMVQAEMVQDKAVVIDVGAPRGDMTREVYQKASVSVEVPGGVGPVTIANLLLNAAELCQTKK
jgi:methylenetetrahydrofolate dehydrogenase (NADP+)/methenyltetrahydrofolate cyclohydrolase